VEISRSLGELLDDIWENNGKKGKVKRGRGLDWR
jgi:hypothetical protein